MARLIAIALLMAGCASATAPAPPQIRDESPYVARGQTGRPVVACLPDGMPPFSEWRDGPVANRAGTVDSLGREVRLLARYHAFGEGEGRTIVVAFWHARPPAPGWRIYSIDPAPDDPAVPFWYDASVVSVDKVAEANVTFAFGAGAKDGCDWRRVGLAAMRV